MSNSPVPSPALLAANTRLQQKQDQSRALRQEQANVPWSLAPEKVYESAVSPGCDPFLATLPTRLPAHLGWGSRAVTIALRRHLTPPEASTHKPSAVGAPFSTPTFPTPDIPSRYPETIQLIPDLGVGLLRRGLTAPGRLWLLCRLLDRRGQGMLSITRLKQQLTTKESSYYSCGPRQLRSLLQQGKGIFWTRDKTRVWLHGPARVAAALGVARLTGRPVTLPSKHLQANAATFRAHLYAAFHAGRAKEGQKPRPIARETIAAVTGVRPALQRTYERLARVRVKRNLAVGGRKMAVNMQEACWQRGRGVFILKDIKGKQGRAGGEYLAWQLPNSYETTLNQRSNGQQKRINARLADLSMKGMTGNGERQEAWRSTDRRYFEDGAAAARAFGGEKTLYWRRIGDGRRGDLWQAIEG